MEANSASEGKSRITASQEGIWPWGDLSHELLQTISSCYMSSVILPYHCDISHFKDKKSNDNWLMYYIAQYYTHTLHLPVWLLFF